MLRSAFWVGDVRSRALRALNYSPAIERIRSAPKRRSTPLADLVAEFGPSYGAVFTRLDCAPEHGIELLTQSDMFAAEPQGRVIRRDSMARPERHLVTPWQVLIAGAGTLGENELYGRSIIADARLAGKFVGPDSMTLVFREPASARSLFAYAFLAGSTGVAAIRSTSYGTKILRFREDLLASLPIPLASDEILERTARLMQRCVEQREVYAQELASAVQLLGERNPRLSHSSGVYGRQTWVAPVNGGTPSLAARNHRPALSAFPDGMKIREMLVQGTPQKANRFTRIPCSGSFGVPFLGQRDLFLIRAIPQYIRRPASTEGLVARKGSIIVAAAGQSGEGTLFGRCELGDYFADQLVSEHTLHLNIDSSVVDHLFVFAVLRTAWGTGALKACATGTSVPSLDPVLLASLQLPRFDRSFERAVAERVAAAYEARSAADYAEVEAVRIVDDEVLPAWLA